MKFDPDKGIIRLTTHYRNFLAHFVHRNNLIHIFEFETLIVHFISLFNVKYVYHPYQHGGGHFHLRPQTTQNTKHKNNDREEDDY